MVKIFASDLNTIRTKVADVLGSGLASFGYGQTVYSSPVTAGQVIREDQWDAVRFDILNSYVHQTGGIPSATDVSIGDTIDDDASSAFQNYNFFADLLRNNRFDIGVGQFVIKQQGDPDAARLDATTVNNSGATWNTSASAELSVTFNNATEARHFFNAGGAIRIITTLAGGTSQQAGAWTTLLDSVNPVDFKGEIIAATGFYTLTDSYQTYFSRAASTPYSANLYQLKAKSDVVDNSAGTATQVDIKIELNDSYVDPGPPAPGDLVDGTLQIQVNEKMPVGLLKPTDTAWTEYKPISYTMSAIALT